jgi:hypothetical protein
MGQGPHVSTGSHLVGQDEARAAARWAVLDRKARMKLGSISARTHAALDGCARSPRVNLGDKQRLVTAPCLGAAVVLVDVRATSDAG